VSSGMSGWTTKYLAIPFEDRGLTHKGCDCWGLYRLIMLQECNIGLPAWPDVHAGADVQKLETILAEASQPQWIPIERGKEAAFDVVLMKGIIKVETAKHMAPIHIGCVVEPGLLIQIELGSGVTIGNYNNHFRIKKRVQGFYRYQGHKDRASLNARELTGSTSTSMSSPISGGKHDG
jgi:hypothetical protein